LFQRNAHRSKIVWAHSLDALRDGPFCLEQSGRTLDLKGSNEGARPSERPNMDCTSGCHFRRTLESGEECLGERPPLLRICIVGAAQCKAHICGAVRIETEIGGCQ